MPKPHSVTLKCNFCFSSFPSFQPLKCSLNICSSCFQKVLTSKGCFNVASPFDHFIYKVMLIKTPICVGGSKEGGGGLGDNLRMTLEAIDGQCEGKMKEFLGKWEGEREKIFKMAVVEKEKQREKEKQKLISEQNLLQEELNTMNPQKQEQNPNLPRLTQQSLRRTNHHKTSHHPLSPSSSLNSSISLSPSLSLKHYLLKPIDHQQQLRLKIISTLSLNPKSPPLPLKLLIDPILSAIRQTSNSNNLIQLVSYNLTNVDLRSYLKVLDWNGVTTVKLVKVGMNNQQFAVLLDVVAEHEGVKTVNVSNNVLTNEAYGILLERLRKGKGMGVENVYMGSNVGFPHKCRQVIKEIREKINLFI